ncbi:vesicle-fusing ATPase 2 [Drosophila takahashii]|uniref:vesicle-fusing ATPase 2 n=1 Tax=Drosophila takahashii TaxID=29030 RepID=UPI001CF80007|nr:vesicle-fusing ATPase 2 [Drosophila takahashii]
MVDSTLLNLDERVEFVGSLIKTIGNFFFADDVCPQEIASRTVNFTRDELRQLVLREVYIAASLRREVTCSPDEDQRIKQVDFLTALQAIKPRFGVQEEALQETMSHGYIQTDQDLPRYEHFEGLSCQLIEGDAKSGLSTVAVQIALEGDFPYINIIKPADLLGKDEEETCRHIENILKDACVSPQSCVIVDDFERVLHFRAVGKRYSEKILQTLMVLLRKQPPRGHGLLILCTSNRRDVLEELGLLSVFTAVRHVPNLSRPDHIMAVMEALKRFEPEEMRHIEAAMEGRNISMGIKRLLELITFVNPLRPDRRAAKFLEKMGEAMGWEDLRA